MITSDNFQGAIIIIIFVSALFTFIISIILLRIYRWSVLKSMKKSGSAGPGYVQKSKTVITRSQISEMPRFGSATTITHRADYDKVIRTIGRNSAFYVTGGLVYAVLLSVAWMYSADKSFGILRFMLLLLCFLWPVIVSLWLMHPKVTWKSFAVYLIVYFLAGTAAVILNQNFLYAQLITIWLSMNGPVTLFLIFISNRYIRSIGPLVFAFLVTGFSGAYIVVDFFSKSKGLMVLSSVIGSQLGLSALVILSFFVLAGLLLFAPPGWLILRWIGRRYQRKKMSDQSLSLDTMWFIFGFFQSFALIEDDILLAFTGIVAFIALKITIRLIRKVVSGNVPDMQSEHTLMLLRVFSLGKKSEELYDATTKVWLRMGSICMLSGPDLATSTLEPHEFYDFIGGRLSRRFIHDEGDLENKLSTMDLLPDPDGRYRVNEFFCMADTWQMTMERLAGRCSVVLMDLRDFSAVHQGSTFELTHLLHSFPVNQIVLLTDQTTDLIFLKKTISSILDNPGISLTNAGFRPEDLHLVAFSKNNRKDMEKLHRLLLSI